MAKLQPKPKVAAPKLAVVKAPPQESGTSKVQARSTVDIEGFRSSDEILDERLMFTIHSQPGNGKTFCAGSASKFWPKDLTKKQTKKVDLNDVVWISADRGATDGFKERGINVPYVVDIPWIMRAPIKGEDKPYASNILDALPLAIEIAYARVEQGETQWVVVDTVSSIDRMLNTYWEQNVPKSNSGKEDRFAMYRLIMKYHSQFYEAMSLFPCGVIFLAHTKALIEGEGDAKTKSKAMALAGDNDLAPSITGKSLETYTANVSTEFALEAIRVPGWKPGDGYDFARWLYPVGGRGYRGKNRFQLSLGTKEKADLGEIVRKIRGS